MQHDSPSPRTSRSATKRNEPGVRVHDAERAMVVIADRYVDKVMRKETWLREHQLEVHSAVIRALRAAAERDGDPERRVQNLDAWVERAGRRAMNTILRRELALKGRRHELEERFESTIAAGAKDRGLSLEVIREEDARSRVRAVRATIAVAPKPEDRELLREYGTRGDLTLADLGRRFGGKTAQGMANHLRRLIGSAGIPGALTPAAVLVGELRENTAEAYIAVLEQLDDLDVVTDPIAAAIGHLEWASRFSERQRARAVLGRARLTWIGRNLPDNRGTDHKVLRRLALAGCYYVLEQHDAVDDAADERGLDDDIAVLEAVFSALKRR